MSKIIFQIDGQEVQATEGETVLEAAQRAGIFIPTLCHHEKLEPFGGSTYRVRAVPEMLGQAEPARALVDVLAEMADGAIPLARETHDKIAIIVCKRASIKGGQILSQEEMRELVRQLEATSAPRTCPHGRPTMVHLSAAQLAREFGRL